MRTARPRPFALTLLGSVALSTIAPSNIAHSAEIKKIGISTIVEVPQLLETKKGVLEALAERGFREGKTLDVEYQSANGSAPTQQQIAKRFVGENMNVIVAITTPTAQAMASASSQMPIVFAAVTDPVKAKPVPGYEPSGTNITGVSDAPPIAVQLC